MPHVFIYSVIFNCVNVTLGTYLDLLRYRNTVEKYGEQHYPVSINWILGK